MSFLAPAFLFGLLGIAVPLLIHLYRREKSRRVAFPSLMFLERIPYRSVRQQRIRHWLLLLVRCAAIALLAFAFGRPYFDSTAAAVGTPEERHETVILVDRSFSMDYADRWQRALEAARSAVSALGPEDRASLIAFDERAAVLVQPTLDHGLLLQAIERIARTDGVTRLAPAMKLARRQLVESDLEGRRVVLISDLQRTAWSAGDDVRLPQGTELQQVDLSDREASNLTVSSVLLDRSAESGRQRIGVSARVTNRGGARFSEVDVTLEIDGRDIETRALDLEPNSSVMVRFEPFTLAGDALGRGVVRLAGDRMEVDNFFHFVLSPAHGISVLELVGEGRDRADDLFVRRALELGQRPFFRFESTAASQLRPADLAGRAVVLVNDAVGSLSAGQLSSLADWVEEGGGLFLALGPAYARRGSAAATDRLGLAPARTISRTSDYGGSIAVLDYSHPILELFSAPRSGDFASAKFFRYHDLEMGSEWSVPARFDDGRPALMERRLGEGRIAVLASGLDTEWNDLALQPVFLPFVHRSIQHLATYATPRDWYTVGQVAELEAEIRGSAASEWLLVTPSGEQETMDLEASRLVPLHESGFYQARPVGTENGAEPTATEILAVNVDVGESDLTPLDAEELAAALLPLSDQGIERADQALTPGDREASQRIWWYVLIAALLLLAFETLLSNRLSTAATEPASQAG